MHFVVNALALLVALPPALATCYYPNGTSVSEWSPTFSAQPCSNDTNSPLAHVCCSVNRPNPSGGSFEDGFTADKCLPNGLCQNVGKDEEGTMLYSYWRDFCTDAEWSAGKCLKNVCTGTGQHSDDGSAEMTPCGDSATATKWCCGTNNTGCCDATDSSEAFVIPVSLGASIPSSSSTSSTVPSDTSSSLSTGTKIGIAVGAGVGGIALVGLIAGLLLYRRRKSNAYRQADTKDTHAFEIGSSTEYSEAEGKSAVPPSYAMFDGRNSEPSEMEGRAISEIDGAVKHKRDGADPVELP